MIAASRIRSPFPGDVIVTGTPDTHTGECKDHIQALTPLKHELADARGEIGILNPTRIAVELR